MDQGLQNKPNHIAIIMDGNGRGAQARSKPRVFGHQKGVERVREIVKEAVKLKLPFLTLYAFSDENWKRPAAEVRFLFTLLDKWLEKEASFLHENNVQLKTIGQLERLPHNLAEKITHFTSLMKDNTGLCLSIAVSYGGRSEIIEACKKVLLKAEDKNFSCDQLSPDFFSKNLFTAHCPDPDLLIRTSGEKRISNFLLWQIAYTELWFTETLWPDFTSSHFLEAIKDFQKRKRRYGRL